MKKDLGIIFGLFLLIAVLLVFGQGFTSVGFLTPNTASPLPKKENTTVRIKTLEVNALIADLPEEKKRGLSERESLPLNEGMLFTFDKVELHGIWMKNVKFAIDIIWIGDDKTVVDIAKNVPPEPNKSEIELTIYKPRSNSKYVLETNAGLSDLHNLQIADKVDFDL